LQGAATYVLIKFYAEEYRGPPLDRGVDCRTEEYMGPPLDKGVDCRTEEYRRGPIR